MGIEIKNRFTGEVLRVAELPNCFREKSRRGVPGPYSKKPQRFMQSSDYEEIMANAHLLAAAPELYEALESLVHAVEAARWPLTAEQMEPLNTARAALAKAVAK